jgi:hypothetical protein
VVPTPITLSSYSEITLCYAKARKNKDEIEKEEIREIDLSNEMIR